MSKELSSEQENLVLEEWNRDPENPPSLYDLTKIIFPKLEKVDGRCKEGRMIKEFLAKHGLKARPSNEYKPKDKIEFNRRASIFLSQQRLYDVFRRNSEDHIRQPRFK